MATAAASAGREAGSFFRWSSLGAWLTGVGWTKILLICRSDGEIPAHVCRSTPTSQTSVP